jgi:hypothetical protein
MVMVGRGGAGAGSKELHPDSSAVATNSSDRKQEQLAKVFMSRDFSGYRRKAGQKGTQFLFVSATLSRKGYVHKNTIPAKM